jgi:TFIIF-interacting CTD phosphatase-like protein
VRSPRDDFDKGDYTIVIDLDSTLIFSRKVEDSTLNDSIASGHSYLKISSTTQDTSSPFYHVYKRPHLDSFLQKLSRHGQLHIFTASTRSYADPIIDQIDPHGYITGRYYREHCKPEKGTGQPTVKDFTVITKNL